MDDGEIAAVDKFSLNLQEPMAESDPEFESISQGSSSCPSDSRTCS